MEPNPILDLTSLLTTGRASESLLDFLGSGEQMSERVSLSFQSATRSHRFIGHSKMGIHGI